MAKFLGDICSVCPNGETVEATFFVNRDTEIDTTESVEVTFDRVGNLICVWSLNSEGDYLKRFKRVPSWLKEGIERFKTEESETFAKILASQEFMGF